MAPTVHRRVATLLYGTNSLITYGTTLYGTNSAPYRWHSNVWHQQYTVQLAHYCMAPTVHCTYIRAMYGTNRAPYRWHCNVWHQQFTVLCCDNSYSGVQLLVAAGRTVIIVHVGGEAGLVLNSLLILKYSYKLTVVMTNCENDSRWLNEHLP